MTRSCADTTSGRIAGLPVLLLALLALGSAALAQDAAPPAAGAPVALGPPKPLTPPAPSSAAGTAQPGGQPVYRPGQTFAGPRTIPPALQPAPVARPADRPLKGGISVNTLGEIDANSVGVLDANSGGFGIDMWRGTPASLVDRLLAQLNRPAALPTARELARRLLLTAARPPAGAKTGAGPSLLARRLGGLLAFGDVVSANALLRVVPARTEEAAVARARMNAAFLMNDRNGACDEARGAAGKYTGPSWRKALVFCQYLAGEGAKAGIGAGLLREQGVKDEAFFTLAAILGGDKGTDFAVPARLMPLHLAMMRAADVRLSETLADTAETGVLRAIAFSPNASLDTRLEAAERAEAAGALESEKLRQIYSGVTFTPADVQDALAGAGNLSGPRGRALLYQAARGQAQPPARAPLLAKAFVLARSQGRLATTVRVFQPLLEEITPSPELAWFAAEAAKALYFAGGAQAAAGGWAQLAFDRPYVPGTGAAASSNVAVWPFVVVAGLPAAPPAAPPAASPAPGGQAQAGGPRAAPSGAPPPRDADGAPDFSTVGAGSARPMKPQGTPTAADALAGVRRVEPAPVVEMITTRPEDPQAVEQAPLAAKPAAPAGSPFDDVMFERWQKIQAGLAGETVAQHRAGLLLGLIDALGAAVPQQAWLASAGAVREMAALPPPGLIRALEDAARGKREGETILLVLAVLGGDGPEKLHPSVAAAAVKALVAVGLAPEARGLALEVAFGAGL